MSTLSGSTVAVDKQAAVQHYWWKTIYINLMLNSEMWEVFKYQPCVLMKQMPLWNLKSVSYLFVVWYICSTYKHGSGKGLNWYILVRWMLIGTVLKLVYA